MEREREREKEKGRSADGEQAVKWVGWEEDTENRCGDGKRSRETEREEESEEVRSLLVAFDRWRSSLFFWLYIQCLPFTPPSLSHSLLCCHKFAECVWKVLSQKLFIPSVVPFCVLSLTYQDTKPSLLSDLKSHGQRVCLFFSHGIYRLHLSVRVTAIFCYSCIGNHDLKRVSLDMAGLCRTELQCSCVFF